MKEREGRKEAWWEMCTMVKQARRKTKYGLKS